MAFGPIDSLIENTVGKVADKLLDYLPDPKAQQDFLIKMREMDWAELKSQLDIDALEAQSQKWWEAGWRPFIGWVCGAAFGYKFVIQPFVLALILVVEPKFPTHMLPTLDWSELAPIMMSLLGLSYHRTQEKTAIATAKGTSK